MKRKTFLLVQLTIALLLLSAAFTPATQIMAAADDDAELCAFNMDAMDTTGAQIQSRCPPGQVYVCHTWHHCAEWYWGLCPLPSICCRRWESGHVCNCFPQNAIPRSNFIPF